MFENLHNSIDAMEQNFSTQYVNQYQVNAILGSEEYDIRTMENQVERYVKDTMKKEEEYKVKFQAHRQSEKMLELYGRSLSEVESDPEHEELADSFRQKIEDEKDNQMELEEWMRKYNANDLNKKRLTYELTKTAIAYRTAFCVRLAEWFATGAAGPGTVTFMDKEYTAS